MPVVALLTDFGLSDAYVGVMKGVILGRCPSVTLVDISHEVPPQDLVFAAYQLESAWRWFPEATVFLVVVDPGVGTARRPVAVRVGSRYFVGPDNGVFSLLPDAEIREIVRPDLPLLSRTFHGRDLFAPVAADLAAGAPFEALGPRRSDPVRLPLRDAEASIGEVIYLDHYGNAITSLVGRDSGVVEVGGREVPVRHAYGSVPVGAVVAVTGSSGRLELSVRNGHAGAALGLERGTPVRWRQDE